MILKSLNLTSDEISKRKTLLVPVPQFGEGAEIMVTEMTVEGCIRQNGLHRKIMDDTNIDDTRRTALMTVANLISVMICPDTGDFLVREDQLNEFHAKVNRETLEALMLANWELNPIKPVQTFEQKKSNS
jgi:hypothetical protein